MSEQLKDFGARAETLVEIPDFAELDRRGRHLRMRRRAGVAGVVAMVLAVAGVVAQAQRNTVKDEPIKPPDLHSHARPYHGVKGDIDAGTYWIRPSFYQRKLTAEFTVPPGWNAWAGPQKGGRNWYVNALVLEIEHVNTHACVPDVQPLSTPEELTDALTQAASTELLRGPEAVQRFGYPATQMRLRVTKGFRQCPESNRATYYSPRDGYIPFAPPGTRLDIWVVDVDGRPIYVQKAWTPKAPGHVLNELDGVVDSIEFKNAE